MITPVFLDTAGLIATWDRADAWHADATKAFAELLSARTPVITTSFVLIECANAAARKPFRSSVIRLRDEMETSGRLIRPSEEDWAEAWEAYRRSESAQAGIVDLISFRIMRKSGITQAFTNDRHFQAAGFETLY